MDNDFKVIFAGKKMYEICVCLHARMHSSKAQTLSVIFWRNINAMVDLSFLQNWILAFQSDFSICVLQKIRQKTFSECDVTEFNECVLSLINEWHFIFKMSVFQELTPKHSEILINLSELSFKLLHDCYFIGNASQILCFFFSSNMTPRHPQKFNENIENQI